MNRVVAAVLNRDCSLIIHAAILVPATGLTDAVDLDGMEEAISEGASPAKAAKALFDAFMRAGGRDNITIIVADVHPG